VLDTPTVIIFSGGTTGAPCALQITHRMQCFQADAYARLIQERLGDNVLDPARNAGNAANGAASSNDDASWISLHIFANFVMLDLCLGGTAVLQPMGLSRPALTVCPASFKNLAQHFQASVTSAPPAFWIRLQETCPQGSLHGVKVALVGAAETCTRFVRSSCELLSPPHDEKDSSSPDPRDCGFFRIYTTTQVLPIAVASAAMIDAEKSNVCA
jgi:acyl-CoA synthetase (AMP-forming)/AMP-acid ligase II